MKGLPVSSCPINLIFLSLLYLFHPCLHDTHITLYIYPPWVTCQPLVYASPPPHDMIMRSGLWFRLTNMHPPPWLQVTCLCYLLSRHLPLCTCHHGITCLHSAMSADMWSPHHANVSVWKNIQNFQFFPKFLVF
jgi:hypothetical protein